MSNYNTGNPVPSTDPRDLDDNATVFDLLLQSSAASVPDRLGVQRKTWAQMEDDAEALVSPNVSALAGLTGAADKLPYFTGAGAMALATLTAAARTVLDDTTVSAMLATMGGAPLASPALTGTPSAPNAAPGTNTTQLATTAFVEAVRVILDAADALKAPLASPALTGTPTGPTAAVGTNTTQLATSAMVQAEIANKRAWTTYTPAITAASGAFTTVSANGRYMVAFGVCHVQIAVTITTLGTASYTIASLPLPALSGSASYTMNARQATASKPGIAIIQNSLTTVLMCDALGADFSASGAVIYISGSYPVA